MTDFHVHFGQFYELYYDPIQVLTTVFQCGQDEAVFSSTTTCLAGVLYAEVEKNGAGLEMLSLGPRVPFFEDS